MDFFDGIQFVRWYDSPKNRKIFEMTFSDYFGLQYNHSGQFVFSCDGSSLKEYSGPCLFISRPGIDYIYGAVNNQPRHHCYICFSGSRVQRYISSGLLRNDLTPFAIANPDSFHMSIIEIMQLLEKGPQNYNQAVHEFEGLLLQTHQISQKQANNPELLREIEIIAERMKKHPERIWILEDIAANLKISYSHFRRIFKQHIGCSPSRFIQIYRLEMAADLIINSRLSLKKISECTLFYDIYHFSKLFKKQFGISPGKYQKDFG